MLTRCPACGTVFRVTAAQLKARQGQVRCGQCRRSFDALAALLDQELPAAAALDTRPDSLSVADVESPEAEAFGAAESSADKESIEPAAVWPLPEAEAAREERSHTWLWAAASLVALLLLLLQAAIQFRTELSILFPETKPALRQTCKLLGCRLALPAKADFLGIEASDMRPGPNGTILLGATLRNRAPFAQTYPDLELTLTDIGNQPLIRKILTPEEYLPKGTDVAAGFAANGERTLNLALQVGVQGSAGYRIYLFYP